MVPSYIEKHALLRTVFSRTFQEEDILTSVTDPLKVPNDK